MNFRDHFQCGIIASIAASGVYVLAKSVLDADPEKAALVFAVCLLGSVIVDLDTHSKPSQIIAFFGSIFCALSLFYREPYYALAFATAFIFIKAFNHHSWIHSYSIPLVLSLYGAYSPESWLLIPFSFGYVVHLRFGDKLKILKKSNWIKSLKIF